MIHRAEDILFAQANEIPNAYVLYDEHYGEAKAAILTFLEHTGIQTAGRYGQWEYSSMEDAIIAGRRCAQNLAA
jgi:protoporphyrinogen oxidase